MSGSVVSGEWRHPNVLVVYAVEIANVNAKLIAGPRQPNNVRRDHVMWNVVAPNSKGELAM
jgi:hypothetical protein